MTLHAVEEMDDDDLSVFDVEHIILTGNIVTCQCDIQALEDKFLIKGYTLSENMAAVVVKISPTGKLVIITVYME